MHHRAQLMVIERLLEHRAATDAESPAAPGVGSRSTT